MDPEFILALNGHGFQPCRNSSGFNLRCSCKPHLLKSLLACQLVCLAVSLLVWSACYHAPNPEEAFAHARQTFVHGDLLASQKEAQRGYKEFEKSRPDWAIKFRVLEADVLVARGMSPQALSLLVGISSSNDRASAVSASSLRGLAYARLHRFSEADRELHDAEVLCTARFEATCGAVSRARGLLAIEQGRFKEAQNQFNESLAFARRQQDHFLESTALLNLSASSLQQGHFDEAVEWSIAALHLSTELAAHRITEAAVGNLGWAHYKLGDSETALDSFLEAKRSAEQLGDILGQVIWVIDIGSVYFDRSDYMNAEQSFTQALALARQIEAEEYIRNALIPLALVYAREGKFDQANTYSDEAIAAARADHNRLDELYPLLVKGQVAAQLHDYSSAAAIFREVARDPQSDSSLKWEAEHSLARLEEGAGHRDSANHEYESALCAFETARSELRHEESKLPFFTNATRIYDDYVKFLVSSGRSAHALEVADFSRARTLAEGLGFLKKGSECSPPSLNPQAVRAKAGASILYYWMGEKQSYLWSITASGIRVFPLPPAEQIDVAVHHYRKAVEEGEDVLASSNADGISLYQTLIAPAAPLLTQGGRVIVIPDGSLNGLNFETLLVPGGAALHYWIEDAVLTNAHSLRLLSQARVGVSARTSKTLLIGDPLAHEPEFPALPNARLEMEDIEKHFSTSDLTVYMQSSATPSAFLSSRPEQYSYIHFVAHAVASSQVPLDSAVILSSGSSDGSFKLYARDIIQHALRARLVTVSACYGAGTKSYSGEGLIGLSWAFLRAGARNTIGALWEVNDASTPQLMDYFYAELRKGRSPDAALHTAKLALIRSNKVLKKPFYWAPFQIYGTA